MDASVALALTIAFVFFTFVGWLLGQALSWRRWKRRTLGVATGEEVEYVLDDLDYTVKRDGEGNSDVALSATYNDYGHESGVREHLRISVGSAAGTEVANALGEMSGAQALQCTLRPFSKGKDGETSKPNTDVEDAL